MSIASNFYWLLFELLIKTAARCDDDVIIGVVDIV